MPQSNKSSRERASGPLLAGCLAAWLVASAGLANATDADTATDSREVYSGTAPQWLRAVGKLRVPGSQYRGGDREHLQEDCSATLVVRLPGRPADTIITAWHCLAHYDDLSRPIIFTLLPGQPGVLQREAYRLADGGGMYADWALLRLRQPVAAAEVAAMLVHPDSADPAVSITMAGYSRDAGKGDGGKRLSFDPACLITARASASSDSNCLAYKGASGGAVVQLSPAGTPHFSGVISEGNGAGLSTFVPVAVFRNAINLHLD
jgi:hypothetical protein